MSFEDDVKDFLQKDQPKPEDIFSMVTIMPKRKMKVTVHLEDKDGDHVLIADLAENLTKFITDQIRLQESTAVNSPMFPMAGQLMTSIVPRFVGLNFAGLMFEASGFRHALLTFGLASMLFMQYIQQHELKIVTTSTELSDEEVQSYLNRSAEAEQRLKSALEEALGMELGNDEDPEDIL